MSEIYWITRFGYFHTVSLIFMIIGIIACVILLIFFYISNGQMIYDEARGHTSSSQEAKEYRITCLKSLKFFIPMTIFFIISFFL